MALTSSPRRLALLGVYVSFRANAVSRVNPWMEFGSFEAPSVYLRACRKLQETPWNLWTVWAPLRKQLPAEQVELRRQTAIVLQLRPPLHPGGRPWAKAELVKLGTIPDHELAAQSARTETAVRVMRLR
jgi:hypothetical protein